MRAMVRGEASLPNSGEFGYGAGGAFAVAEVAHFRALREDAGDDESGGKSSKLWRVRLRRWRRFLCSGSRQTLEALREDADRSNAAWRNAQTLASSATARARPITKLRRGADLAAQRTLRRLTLAAHCRSTAILAAAPNSCSRRIQVRS